MYVVNPRGSVRKLEEDVARKMLQIPGWIELTDPQLQKYTYLPQYDRGTQATSSVAVCTEEYKEKPMERFATRIV